MKGFGGEALGGAMTSVRRTLRRRARMVSAALSVVIIVGMANFPARAQSQSSESSDELRLGPLSNTTRAPTLLTRGAGVYDITGNAHRNEPAAVDAELRLGPGSARPSAPSSAH